MQEGYNADSLHGELSQAQRDTVMQKFRICNLQLLVATDVAARGLDVDDLTHVINYGLPDDTESYTCLLYTSFCIPARRNTVIWVFYKKMIYSC